MARNSRTVLVGGALSLPGRGSASAIVTCTEEAQARGELVDTLDPALFAVAWLSYFYFALITWVQGAHPSPANKLVLLVPAGVVSGPAWAGFWKVAVPMMRYRWKPTEKRLRAFVRNLLTTTDDDWMPYLGDAFLSYRLNMSIPKLARPEEFENLKAPTFVVGADGDLSFPGEALVARAGTLFPALAATEILKGSHHCPPTTESFRGWLGERISSFLLDVGSPGLARESLQPQAQ